MKNAAEILQMSITQMHQGLQKGDFSVMELIEAHRQQIEKINPESNAIVHKTFDYAEERVKIEQKKIDSGETSELLAGIPLIVKDNYCMQGIPTTASSKMLQNFVPPYTATVVQKLEDAGMICLGKANMDEFALGSANQNSFFGDVQNPLVRNDGEQIIPGGSSGGSASAVATFMGSASLGTDTGGSVRQPAACCGIVGLKPTYGMFSRFGIVTFASSLDQAGIFARSVEDCALLFDAMKGFDPKDNSSLNHNPPKIFDKLQKSENCTDLNIGFAKEFTKITEGTVPKLYGDAEKIFQKNNVNVEEVSLPSVEYSLAAYYTVCCAEVYSNMARFDGVRYGLSASKSNKSVNDFYQEVRNNGFGNEVKLRIMTGNYLLSNKSNSFDHIFHKAKQVRRKLIDDFAKVFEEVDVIITPIFINTARPMKSTVNSLEDRLNDTFTSCVNLAGLPGLSIPLFLHEDGLPVALQLIGNYGQELKLLRIAKMIEQETGFIQRMREKLFEINCV